MTFQQLLGGKRRNQQQRRRPERRPGLCVLRLCHVLLGRNFSDASASRYLEIHRTNDTGKTWSTVHSQPYQGDLAYISLSVDQTGAIHAMHYTTDSLGASLSYDAHYVLP